MLPERRFAGLKELLTAVGNRGLAAIGSRSKANRLQDDPAFVTLQVGKSAFDQAPRQMRVELWMSSLQRKGVGVAAAAKYEDMLLTPVSEEAAADIEKDLARTFPNMKRFASPEGQEALRRVLMAYAALDPEVGYCQGMNFVAGLLLIYLPERHAFGGLVVLMQDRGLRKYYSTDMSLLQTHLWQLGRLMPQKLCSHLEACGVLPLLYGASWLMTCFSADFPASFSARVMDVIMSDKMDQALLKAAVALLKRCEIRLLQLADLEDALHLLKLELPAWEEQLLHDVLTEAFSKPWSNRQLQLLGSVEGAETVAEALDRVRRANLAAADGPGDETAAGSAPSSTNSTPSRSVGEAAGGAVSVSLPFVLPPPSPARPSSSCGSLPGSRPQSRGSSVQGSAGGAAGHEATAASGAAGMSPSNRQQTAAAAAAEGADADAGVKPPGSLSGLTVTTAAQQEHQHHDMIDMSSPRQGARTAPQQLLPSNATPTIAAQAAEAGMSEANTQQQQQAAPADSIVATQAAQDWDPFSAGWPCGEPGPVPKGETCSQQQPHSNACQPRQQPQLQQLEQQQQCLQQQLASLSFSQLSGQSVHQSQQLLQQQLSLQQQQPPQQLLHNQQVLKPHHQLHLQPSQLDQDNQRHQQHPQSAQTSSAGPKQQRQQQHTASMADDDWGDFVCSPT